MASVAVTNTFVANTDAKASEVNTNFSDLVTYVNNRNSGSSTWDAVSSSHATNVPITANNSSGTQNIANFQDNGSNVLSVADGGATTLTASGATSICLTVNNGTSTGLIARFQDNGTNTVEFPDGGGANIKGAASATNLTIMNTAGGGGGDAVLTFATDSTTRVTMGCDISDSNKFKIGTTAVDTGTFITFNQATPSISFSATTSIVVDSATPLALNRTTNDGTLIDLQQDGSSEGTISVSGTTVSYNTFIGAHYYQLKLAQTEFKVGQVLIATGEMIPCKTPAKERFSFVDTTNSAGDQRVYGVHIGKIAPHAQNMSFGLPNRPVYSIASLGLFGIRVTDTAGNINAGDYIQASARPGEGEKQVGAQLRNGTVGKAIVSVDWTAVTADPVLGYKWKLIPATIHCG